ncbi:MAG: ligase-associated DNA damage response endonuclease PdeM [Salinarimonadaceae bacterium]|nr:MAG: ligase-associated DNA damage response endonuclease PdeM [Salinarimonadaceae bacterium]TVR10701.1 MAG: ligase-associated DNA damage response endonuclease PdeM [Salinarimonadaceae bacterium]
MPRSCAPHAFSLGRLALVCDLSGVLCLPDEDALLVADLHFEKGSSRARRGFLLPPYDTRDTLSRLAAVIAAHDPRRVIAMGDSFHDPHAAQRLCAEDREALAGLMRGREWLWLTGNHDPDAPAGIGGDAAAEIEVAGVRLRHEPSTAPGPEIAGHLHPVAKVVGRGGRVRRRCFATSGERCVMPAFGAYAGGLNVRDPAFAPLFPDGLVARVIGRERVYGVGAGMLAGD